MRLGLLADIHEAVEPLALAIQELRARHVDAFVMLGDALDAGERVEETVALLTGLPGVGVWGNHDRGLCGDVDPVIGRRFTETTLQYFARLRPWVELEGCRFQHVDPHLDPERFEDLWCFSTPEERMAGLRGCSFRRVFIGHLHDWAVFTPDRQVPWDASGPFRYEDAERYLTIVHALADGWCATLDTDRQELTPIRVWTPPAPTSDP